MSQKSILVLGASSSRNSINKQFASFAADRASQKIENLKIDLVDLNDFEMPIYSIDRENENGIHPLATAFKQHIDEASAIIISFAEHNGAYSAAFKNVYDWVSRIDGKVWQNKPMLLLSTSPGGRGGMGVLGIASKSYRFSYDAPIAEFSLPAFGKNFDPAQGITDPELAAAFAEQLSIFTAAI